MSKQGPSPEGLLVEVLSPLVPGGHPPTFPAFITGLPTTVVLALVDRHTGGPSPASQDSTGQARAAPHLFSTPGTELLQGTGRFYQGCPFAEHEGSHKVIPRKLLYTLDCTLQNLSTLCLLKW